MMVDGAVSVKACLLGRQELLSTRALKSRAQTASRFAKECVVAFCDSGAANAQEARRRTFVSTAAKEGIMQ